MGKMVRFQILSLRKGLAGLAAGCLLLTLTGAWAGGNPTPSFTDMCAFAVPLALTLVGACCGISGLNLALSLGGTRKSWFAALQITVLVCVLAGRLLLLALGSLQDVLCPPLQEEWNLLQIYGRPGIWPCDLLYGTGMVVGCLGGVLCVRKPVRGLLILCGAVLAQLPALMVLTFGILLAQREPGTVLDAAVGIGCLPVLALGEAGLWLAVRRASVV